MAEIQHLDKGQSPPDGVDWILVESGAAGGYYVSSRVAGKKEAAAPHAEALATPHAAFELAEKLAARHGIDVIYSKGVRRA